MPSHHLREYHGKAARDATCRERTASPKRELNPGQSTLTILVTGTITQGRVFKETTDYRSADRKADIRRV